MEKETNVYYIKKIDDAIEFAKRFNPDLVIISNRKDLSDGATETFRKNGFRVFGITKEVAKLETVKEYAKDFMIRNKINTPDFYVAKSEDEAVDFIMKNWNKKKYGYVLKVDQFSKNSFERTAVPNNLNECIKEINRLFATTPDSKLIIEEKIIGYELSLHVLINNGKYSILPLVQDYKKKYPNNEGPMTAGTVSVATTKNIPNSFFRKIEEKIVEPTIKGFISENIEYNYILYIGLIISESGKPYVLEYNTRSGNPEWLALLGLLEKPYTELIEKYYNNIEEISDIWKKDYCSIAMYGFSAGYPETERKNFYENIIGLSQVKKDTDVIGEHIIEKNNILYPTGGRVFALRRTGRNFEKIRQELIEDFYNVKMNGLYFREDINMIKLK